MLHQGEGSYACKSFQRWSAMGAERRQLMRSASGTPDRSGLGGAGYHGQQRRSSGPRTEIQADTLGDQTLQWDVRILPTFPFPPSLQNPTSLDQPIFHIACASRGDPIPGLADET